MIAESKSTAGGVSRPTSTPVKVSNLGKSNNRENRVSRNVPTSGQEIVEETKLTKSTKRSKILSGNA